jgi:hypothetical protein
LPVHGSRSTCRVSFSGRIWKFQRLSGYEIFPENTTSYPGTHEDLTRVFMSVNVKPCVRDWTQYSISVQYNSRELPDLHRQNGHLVCQAREFHEPEDNTIRVSMKKEAQAHPITIPTMLQWRCRSNQPRRGRSFTFPPPHHSGTFRPLPRRCWRRVLGSDRRSLPDCDARRKCGFREGGTGRKKGMIGVWNGSQRGPFQPMCRRVAHLTRRLPHHRRVMSRAESKPHPRYMSSDERRRYFAMKGPNDHPLIHGCRCG